MKDITLGVLAGGMGSRFGGIKQIEPVGPNGEMIIDYSIYDAIRADFSRAVFVVRSEIKDAFYERVVKKWESKIDISLVLQDKYPLPDGFVSPEARKKPWGTGHAALCIASMVKTPFCVINADDFYGRHTFLSLSSFLSQIESNQPLQCAMVGYRLSNTLTEHGAVSRGVCAVSGNGYLTHIVERTGIIETDAGIIFDGAGENERLAGDTPVSLNVWAFPPEIAPALDAGFRDFLHERNEEILETAEFYLPAAIDRMIKENNAAVRVLETPEKWYGVTYRADIPGIKSALCAMHGAGIYPASLWG